jgi:hypothetical protein
MGTCCPPGSTEAACIDSATVTCSQNYTATNANAKYAFCPRKTQACGGSGPLLRPLLNQNQTEWLHTSLPGPTFMNFTNGDVCFWELYVDPEAFKAAHSYTSTSASLGQVYINIAFDVLPSTVQAYAMQGTSKRNATSITLNSTQGKANIFPLANGERVILMAYPNAASIGATQLQFTYNLSSPFYPVQGLDAQLKAETAPDVDSTNYWLVFIIVFGLVLFILLIVFFTVCCKDFDPESEFERRRRVQAQAKLEDAPKKMKKAAK